eukprot:jgi/Galph1/4814/GphlegSOOS_G3448.1
MQRVLLCWFVLVLVLIQWFSEATLNDLSINAERVVEDLRILGQFSDGNYPGITRILYSNEDCAARRFLTALFQVEGLNVSHDPVGNLFARWDGSEPELPAVGTGSHFDTLINAGLYDGTLGILGALEAIRSLKNAGFVPKRSIEIVAFTSEEVSRFGVGCVGSRYLVGDLQPNDIQKLRDENGNTFETLRKRCGYTEPLSNVARKNGHYSAFLELHIEQYHVLEDEKIPIGLVTDIAAPALYTVELKGPGGHAGSVPIDERQDPFMAACELALSLESVVLQESDVKNARITFGKVEVFPGSAGAIPRAVLMSLDMRDKNEEQRTRLVSRALDRAAAIAKKRRVNLEVFHNYSYPPAKMNEEILLAMEDACTKLQLGHKKMVSRPFHDSLFMASKFPTGMIFIPCKEGKSHVPDEYASPEDIHLGIKVLAETLARLSYQ